jgi:hypothetical protein
LRNAHRVVGLGPGREIRRDKKLPAEAQSRILPETDGDRPSPGMHVQVGIRPWRVVRAMPIKRECRVLSAFCLR